MQGHFLPGAAGPLAVVVFEPPSGVAVRFAVLHVPPAFDEMNKSRRMAALQARAMAQMGGFVALLDPRGTGDSAGDHGDATWAGWSADVRVAWEWLRDAGAAYHVLWGTRLGAALAFQELAERRMHSDLLVLWQPVISGRMFFTQYLRLATAQQFTGGAASALGAASMRERLVRGETIELGGYAIHPDLVAGAETAELQRLATSDCRVIWREISLLQPASLAPASLKILSSWRSRGVSADAAVVAGPAFWCSQDIVDAPDLVASTNSAMSRWLNADAIGH